MKWTLLFFPVLALAQQPELKELPKIDLFPPGGIHSLIPQKKKPVKAAVESTPGQCAVPLVNVDPPSRNGIITVIPQQRGSVAMPNMATPAPPCQQ